jgi:hypothetical protein
MFIGHLGVGFAAKRAAPRSSLAVLLAAAMLLDLVWPVLLLTGIERVRIAPGDTAFTPLEFTSYPWSHSALLTIVWAALFAGAVWAATRDRAGALVAAALVASHWVLDVASHRADLPLWPGGPTVGLGLWGSVPATVAVEGAIFLCGVFLYVRATRPRDGIGRWVLAALVALLAAAYAGSATGAPPPSVQAIAIVNLASTALVLLLAAWVDRHRAAAAPRRAS